MRPSRRRAALLVAGALLAAFPLEAAPVRVRFPEATTRGFLAVRTPEGRRIGHGELTQKVQGERGTEHARVEPGASTATQTTGR